MIICDELYLLKEDTISMTYEIGCMCKKCDCDKKALLVTAVCDSCLKNNHTDKIPAN